MNINHNAAPSLSEPMQPLSQQTALDNILAQYHLAAKTEREKGCYFEELICSYLRHEAFYRDEYSEVWLYGDWAQQHPQFGLNAKDTGIDIVAKHSSSKDYHAIQCKCYAPNYRLQKKTLTAFLRHQANSPLHTALL